MNPLRSIIALVGGFAIMAFLVFVLVAVVAWIFPVKIGAPTTLYLVANLVLSALAALAGGYATASLAPGRPRMHAAVLALMVLAMSLSQLASPPPGQPNWYPGALSVIGPLFAQLGGFLRRPRNTATTIPVSP